ncbi:MAG: hypothetical protein WKF41_06795 [Gaiellaceae bacterium]
MRPRVLTLDGDCLPEEQVEGFLRDPERPQLAEAVRLKLAARDLPVDGLGANTQPHRHLTRRQ